MNQKPIAILGAIHGIADVIAGAYHQVEKNKTMMDYITQARARCQECLDHFPGQLDRRQIERIRASLQAMENEVAGKASAATLTAMALALLSDVRDEVEQIPEGKYNRRRKSERLRAIDRLHTTFRQMHRHFDRRLDRWGDYDAAARAVDKLYGVEG